MNAFADGASMPLLTLALKASALLGVTALTMLLIGRRASAATRHWAWSLAVVSLLGLPVLSLSLPAWSVAVPVAATVAPPAVSTNAAPVGNDDASVPPLAESSAAASVIGCVARRATGRRSVVVGHGADVVRGRRGRDGRAPRRAAAGGSAAGRTCR